MTTITKATLFYLVQDPLNPSHSPDYHWNLIYTPEPRWYLWALLEKANIERAQSYNMVTANHQKISTALAKEGNTVTNDGQFSHFNEVEVQAILEEGLEDFFQFELSWTIHALYPSHASSLTFQHHSLTSSRKSRVGWQRRNSCMPCPPLTMNRSGDQTVGWMLKEAGSEL